MKFLKGLGFKLLVLLVIFIGLFFGTDNSEAVSIVFLEYETPAFPISGWVLVSFVLGVLFSSLINMWTNTGLRLAVRKANTQVQKTHQTLDKVRAEKIDNSEISEPV